VFARAISNRENNDNNHTLTDTFDNICQTAQTTPRIVKCDSEFAQGHIMDYFRTHNIKVIKSRSHVPTDNAVVERYNREIRKKIRAGFVKRNNFAWVAHLDDYIENINNQKKTGENESPNEKWVAGYVAPVNPQPVAAIRRNNIHKDVNFRVNDVVRIKLYSINNKTRAREKNGMEASKNVINFTPEVYKIYRIYGNGATRKYAVKRLNIPNIQPTVTGIDEIIYEDDGFHYKKFFGSDLLKVGTRNRDNVNHTSIFPQTNTRALRINKIKGNIDVI
jgi:hypothetical protein